MSDYKTLAHTALTMTGCSECAPRNEREMVEFLVGISEGRLVVVPAESTKAMQDAANAAGYCTDNSQSLADNLRGPNFTDWRIGLDAIYRAMINAAQQPLPGANKDG